METKSKSLPTLPSCKIVREARKEKEEYELQYIVNEILNQLVDYDIRDFIAHLSIYKLINARECSASYSDIRLPTNKGWNSFIDSIEFNILILLCL